MFKGLQTELKVGLFAVVAIVTLGYMFFVLSPEMFENTKYDQYYTMLDNAAGIVSKTHVMTSGVAIGRVKSVALDGGSTKVIFEIDQSVKLPEGSKIEVASVGLLGDKHLEITRPKNEGRFIAPKNLVPQSTDGAGLETLLRKVSDIANDVKKVTNTLANVLGNKKGEQSVQNIVDNIEGITADVKTTTATLKKVLGEREDDLQDVVTNVRDGIRDLRKVAANLKEVVSDQNKERVSRILASFDETMVDVKGSAKNINLISAKVEKGEGTIGRLVNDDTTLTELEGALKDIRKVLAPATKLQIDVDYHGEIRRDTSSQHYVNLIFRTRPDRYYLLGLTDSKYEVEDKTVEPEPSDPGKTRTKETIRRENRIRFNLQVAKRWYWIAARFGLFETTGGIATDMYAWNDRLKLSLEAFDWDTQDKTVRRNAHLKAYASALFYNHIYALVGIDDPTKTDPNSGKARALAEGFFVGAGLTFTDDDLKAIFGAAALAK